MDAHLNLRPRFGAKDGINLTMSNAATDVPSQPAEDDAAVTLRLVRRLVLDIGQTADVVGFTIAEFIPRQVIALQQLVKNFPLLTRTE